MPYTPNRTQQRTDLLASAFEPPEGQKGPISVPTLGVGLSEEAPPVERRREKRERPDNTHWLTIRSNGGNAPSLVGEHIDISASGLGLLTLEPVCEGQEFRVAGEVEIGGQWKAISGNARVVYCQQVGKGTYHVGLSSLDVKSRSIRAPK